MDDSSISKLSDRVDFASKTILDWVEQDQPITVVSHLDADGLAAAGIIGSMLERLNVAFKVRIVKQLDEDSLKELSSEPISPIIFADVGSGQKDLIYSNLPEHSVVIIDHHQPLEYELERCVEVNPHLFGIDGSRSISSSGLSYLVAKSVDLNNVDLAPIAVVGALGDRQDSGKRHNLVDLNESIVKEAVEAGFLEVKFGLRLFGFESRPIVKSLEYTIDPLIPGLSGNYNACLKFLERIGITPVDEDGNLRRMSDLSSNELRSFMVNLVKYMLSKGIESKEAESIMGTIYIISHEPPTSPLRDAREFASLLNACGRLGVPSIGVAICMGRRGEVLDKAEKLTSRYRQTLLKYLDWLSRNLDKVRQTRFLQVIYGGDYVDDRIIGTLISIALSSRILSPKKVAVAFAVSPEGKVKVSARADKALARRGLNLGLAIRDAASQVEGVGGGHDVAAGAQIPLNSEEDFIEVLDKIIAEQLGSE